MKYLLFLILLTLISCGGGETTVKEVSDTDMSENPELWHKVKYKVWLEDLGGCTGYNVNVLFLDENERTIDFYHEFDWPPINDFEYTFFYRKDYSRWYNLEIDGQGNLGACGAVHAEVYIDDILVSEKLGTFSNEIFDADYYYGGF